MKIGVVVFPGSNCDEDLVKVLKTFSDLSVVKLWHKDSDSQDANIIFLPGGFSYGDYLRSGAIARFSPIMSAILKHAKAGKLIIGICNGFQILTESGLLPGALLKNNEMRFICQNQHIKVISNQTFFTNSCNKNQVLNIPIAHGDGRYHADAELLDSLMENDQIIFKYSDSNGNTDENSNPNGSINNIAGICNKERNIIGMMPHPERAFHALQGNTDGLSLFQSLFSYEKV